MERRNAAVQKGAKREERRKIVKLVNLAEKNDPRLLEHNAKIKKMKEAKKKVKQKKGGGSLDVYYMKARENSIFFL